MTTRFESDWLNDLAEECEPTLEFFARASEALSKSKATPEDQLAFIDLVSEAPAHPLVRALLPFPARGVLPFAWTALRKLPRETEQTEAIRTFLRAAVSADESVRLPTTLRGAFPEVLEMAPEFAKRIATLWGVWDFCSEWETRSSDSKHPEDSVFRRWLNAEESLRGGNLPFYAWEAMVVLAGWYFEPKRAAEQWSKFCPKKTQPDYGARPENMLTKVNYARVLASLPDASFRFANSGEKSVVAVAVREEVLATIRLKETKVTVAKLKAYKSAAAALRAAEKELANEDAEGLPKLTPKRFRTLFDKRTPVALWMSEIDAPTESQLRCAIPMRGMGRRRMLEELPPKKRSNLLRKALRIERAAGGTLYDAARDRQSYVNIFEHCVDMKAKDAEIVLASLVKMERADLIEPFVRRNLRTLDRAVLERCGNAGNEEVAQAVRGLLEHS